ncbi:uncharacterized protein [Arachis hypogaea]|uniref:uncharacterized protein n=1 Tax=Arachis hypogaea TaxID=3818 RepID=UPI003B210676
MMRKEDENDESIKESSSLRKILAVNFNFLHMLVGDDFLMFNAKRIERVVLEYACNPLFLKVKMSNTRRKRSMGRRASSNLMGISDNSSLHNKEVNFLTCLQNRSHDSHRNR